MRTLAFIVATTALGAVSVPASAQYYPQPQQPYPQQGYGNPQPQGGIAGLIGQLLGGRNYAANDRQAVGQCAAAAQAHVAQRNQAADGQRGYDPRYGQQGYDPRYGQQNSGYGQPHANQVRVTAITNVERRGRNNVRVTGLIDSGMNGYGQQPNGNAYGYNRNQQAYGQADLSFRCTVDAYGRVTALRLNRTR